MTLIEIFLDKELENMQNKFEKPALSLINHLESCSNTIDCINLINPQNIISCVDAGLVDLSNYIALKINTFYNNLIKTEQRYKFISRNYDGIISSKEIYEIFNNYATNLWSKIEQYNEIYANFIIYYNNNYDKASFEASYNGGVIGGMIGSVFGPVGTLIGGVIGGIISGSSASDEYESKLNYLYNNFKEIWRVFDLTFETYINEIIPVILNNIEGELKELQNKYTDQKYLNEVKYLPYEKLVCYFCKIEVKSNWKVCPECGNKISKNKTCIKCNLELEERWKNCPECGTSV